MNRKQFNSEMAAYQKSKLAHQAGHSGEIVLNTQTPKRTNKKKKKKRT